MLVEMHIGRYTSLQERSPRGGDTELYLKCCLRFHQSGNRVQREQWHGGKRKLAIVGSNQESLNLP